MSVPGNYNLCLMSEKYLFPNNDIGICSSNEELRNFDVKGLCLNMCGCFLCMFQYMTAAAAAAPMQGTYIPQYTPVPPTAVPVEVRPANKHTLLTKSHKSVPVYSQRIASLLIHPKLAHHI